MEMTRAIKQLLLPPATAIARLTKYFEGAARIWRVARLAADIRHPVDSSVVLLGKVEVRGTGDIQLGRELYFYPGLYLETQQTGKIVIGDGVVISRGAHLVSFAGIEIGEGCMIGEYVSIRDANHVWGGDAPLRTSGYKALPIRIGRNVWIARGVCVLSGVTIGDNAVVGANAVVTKDVLPGIVVVGVPAAPLVIPASPETAWNSQTGNVDGGAEEV